MRRFSILFVALWLVLSCRQNPEQKESVSAKTLSQVAKSSNGMVSSAHPLATAAGVAILEKGGNAADAAVAVGFALAVVEPSMNGIGGRFQAIYRSEQGVVSGIDATTQAPLSYDATTATKSRNGYPTIGVPGVVKGLTTLLEQQGTMDLQTIMASAIDYAENGFDLLPGEAYRHASAIDNIRQFEGTSMYFLNEDTTTLAGQLFIQKDLANTLKVISEKGAAGFYEGEVAEKMVADVQANGGYLDLQSLREYIARDAKIVTGNYRGYDLHTLWMPSFGAITIEMLHIMENFDLENCTDAEWANLFYKANTIAYRDRRKQKTEEMADLLTSKSYARAKADSLKGQNELNVMIQNQEEWLVSDGHTTHFSVADKFGNVVAVTQTIGPNMGSKVATPGLGFLYATTMGGYLGDFKAGQRAASHISPTLVTLDGKPFLVLGAAGGSRIPTAIVQTISRMVDRKMSLQEAVAAGRVHSVDTAILVEMHEGTTWTDQELTEFKALGLEVVPVEGKGRFGRVHAIAYNPQNSTWIGAADPDWEGTSDFPKLK